MLAIGISAFPAIAINVWQGVKSVDNKLLAMGRVYGVSRSRRFTHIVFPQIAPYLVASSRFGLGIIWKITVVAELIGQDSGIGFQLHYWFQLFNMPQVFAWTLFFTLIMLAIELGILQTGRKVSVSLATSDEILGGEARSDGSCCLCRPR